MLRLLQDFFQVFIRYREYFRQSVTRDLRRRYKRSFLGYIWSMLNPLLMMAILTIVFANIMKQELDDYAVFLISGMLPFTYFSATGLASLGTIRANAGIFNQVSVPKMIFPLSLAISGLIDMLLSIGPLILVMIICNHAISWSVLFLPVVLIPLFFFTTGISMVLAAGNVFFEDTQHLTDVAFRALYFLCPILYSGDLLPEWLLSWVKLNPLFSSIEFIRGIFYSGTIPSIQQYAINFGSCLLVLTLGLLIFRKTEDNFEYYL